MDITYDLTTGKIYAIGMPGEIGFEFLDMIDKNYNS